MEEKNPEIIFHINHKQNKCWMRKKESGKRQRRKSDRDAKRIKERFFYLKKKVSMYGGELYASTNWLIKDKGKKLSSTARILCIIYYKLQFCYFIFIFFSSFIQQQRQQQQRQQKWQIFIYIFSPKSSYSPLAQWFFKQ